MTQCSVLGVNISIFNATGVRCKPLMSEVPIHSIAVESQLSQRHAAVTGSCKAAAQADAAGASPQGRQPLCALSCSKMSQSSAVKAAAKLRPEFHLSLRVHACAGAMGVSKGAAQADA